MSWVKPPLLEEMAVWIGSGSPRPPERLIAVYVTNAVPNSFTVHSVLLICVVCSTVERPAPQGVSFLNLT